MSASTRRQIATINGRFDMLRTASAFSAFDHPQAADAERVNGPWHNLTNAVSPCPVNAGAASQFYRAVPGP